MKCIGLVITFVGVATLMCCGIIMWGVVNSGDPNQMAGAIVPMLVISVVSITISCFGLCVQETENKKCKG